MKTLNRSISKQTNSDQLGLNDEIKTESFLSKEIFLLEEIFSTWRNDFLVEEMIFLLKKWFSYWRNDFLFTEEINNLDNGQMMKVTNIYKHEK